MRTWIALLVATSVAIQTGCQGPRTDYRALAADAEPLHMAVEDLTSVIVYDIFSPPQASRAYAYASIAAIVSGPIEPVNFV
jgi:hypothetical protein